MVEQLLAVSSLGGPQEGTGDQGWEPGDWGHQDEGVTGP